MGTYFVVVGAVYAVVGLYVLRAVWEAVRYPSDVCRWLVGQAVLVCRCVGCQVGCQVGVCHAPFVRCRWSGCGVGLMADWKEGEVGRGLSELSRVVVWVCMCVRRQKRCRCHCRFGLVLVVVGWVFRVAAGWRSGV